MKRHVLSLALGALALGCSSRPNPAPLRVTTTAPPTSATPAAPSAPPEWFVTVAGKWVEALDDGLHRGTAGARFESRGRKLVGIADKPPAIEDGRVAPPWALGEKTPCKYVFWREGEVFGASEWLGEARSIATLNAPVQESFDWFDGVGIVTPTGLFVVHAASCVLDKLDLPNAATVSAASANRALVLTALGHARQTNDAGKTFRDITSELPNAAAIEREADGLHVSTDSDELFVLNDQGVKPLKQADEHPRNEPRPDPEDRWPEEHDGVLPLEAAATNGILLPNGEAIVTDDGLVARVQIATGRATEILRFGASGETCLPVAVKDRLLVVCESGRRASVIDAGSGQIERTFDIEQEVVWDRFAASDGEALGFVGPCGGRNPPPPVDVVTNASSTNSSLQRSPTFCVRTASGTWVEHQLDAADATDILAWLPHADGGATAVVAIAGTFLHQVMPVETRGSLRIVRMPRNAPPIDITTYANDTPKLLSRALRSLPDGGLEGWLPSGHSPSGQMAVRIDADGRVQQRPLPSRTSGLVTNGRFALAHTEDNRYFESTDFGRSFQPIEPPPGRQAEPMSVSDVGARVGPFLRVGWGGQTKPVPLADPIANEPSFMQTRRLPPAVRLSCRFSGPPDSGRMSDSIGLGLSKQTMSQMSPGRIPFVGGFFVPWRGLPNVTTGNADFVLVPLFDLAAPVRRVSVPLSRMEGEERILHEMRLGFVLDGPNVLPVAAERFSRCAASLLDETGLTVPFGTCLDDPSVGTVIEGRVFLVHPDVMTYIATKYAKIVISTADLNVDRSGKTKPRATNIKTLATHHLSGGIGRYKFAMGERGKKPVVVAIDTQGNATLAPIDPGRGTIGAEEPLVSLSKLQLGNDPRCAEAPDDARVLFVFTNEMGLDPRGLPGVRESEQGGLAVLRWSKQRVCLDAIDTTVIDERYEGDAAVNISHGPVRKVVARFDKPHLGKGTLALITYGMEVRQPLVCEGAAP